MKKLNKLVVVLLSALLFLSACGGGGKTPSKDEGSKTPEKEALVYEEGTELRVAAGYNDSKTGISFQDASITGEGITLADGVTYHTGDLKPTWAHLSDKLKIKFTDKFSGAGSAAKEFAVWENQLEAVDIVAGSVSVLNAAGAEGKLVNLAEYLDVMPNFKAYFEENPIARLSITGNTENGAIYFSPYFDGNDDIERMPLVRADFVRTLLDGDAAYKGANRALAAYVYTPYMPTSGKVEVESLTADGTGKQTITKDYDAYGNIIEKMNAAPLTGDQAVAMFREYIDATYGDQYANRSDLFLGYNAAWDADEMVALLRCGVASLTDADGKAITGLFGRETENLARNFDLVRFAGQLFGVRGVESRNEYLYFDKDGNLHDARQEEATYAALERMNAMTKEGLIITTGTGKSETYLEKDSALMSYDYNQTQTLFNDTKLQDGEEYLAIMVPVAKWDDGTGEKYERFTESWRSVKTDGWAITVAGAGADKNRLNAALTLIDYAFSVQGQITMSYGPDSLIKVKDASVEVKTWDDIPKKYETFNFNGKPMPVISDENFAQLQSLANGNYTNFARRYLGSTLNGFPKSQAFEAQCTNAAGKKGLAVLIAGIEQGIIKHPLLAVNTANMWYTSVPTALPTTAEQTNTLKQYADLLDNFSTSKGGLSILWNLIADGYTVSGVEATPAAYAANVKDNWGGSQYLLIKQMQWNTLKTYYESLK